MMNVRTLHHKAETMEEQREPHHKQSNDITMSTEHIKSKLGQKQNSSAHHDSTFFTMAHHKVITCAVQTKLKTTYIWHNEWWLFQTDNTPQGHNMYSSNQTHNNIYLTQRVMTISNMHCERLPFQPDRTSDSYENQTLWIIIMIITTTTTIIIIIATTILHWKRNSRFFLQSPHCAVNCL